MDSCSLSYTETFHKCSLFWSNTIAVQLMVTGPGWCYDAIAPYCYVADTEVGARTLQFSLLVPSLRSGSAFIII